MPAAGAEITLNEFGSQLRDRRVGHPPAAQVRVRRRWRRRHRPAGPFRPFRRRRPQVVTHNAGRQRRQPVSRTVPGALSNGRRNRGREGPSPLARIQACLHSADAGGSRGLKAFALGLGAESTFPAPAQTGNPSCGKCNAIGNERPPMAKGQRPKAKGKGQGPKSGQRPKGRARRAKGKRTRTEGRGAKKRTQGSRRQRRHHDASFLEWWLAWAESASPPPPLVADGFHSFRSIPSLPRIWAAFAGAEGGDLGDLQSQSVSVAAQVPSCSADRGVPGGAGGVSGVGQHTALPPAPAPPGQQAARGGGGVANETVTPGPRCSVGLLRDPCRALILHSAAHSRSAGDRAAGGPLQLPGAIL